MNSAIDLPLWLEWTFWLGAFALGIGSIALGVASIILAIVAIRLSRRVLDLVDKGTKGQLKDVEKEE